MKKSKKKKNKKRIANNYLGMAAIAIVVLLLLGGLTYQSQTLKAVSYTHLDVYKRQAERYAGARTCTS